MCHSDSKGEPMKKTPFPIKGIRLGACLMCCLLGLMISGCKEKESAGPAATAPPTVQVVVAEVLSQTIPVIQEVTGRTDASASVDLRARIEGILDSMSFEEGKMVKAEAILYQIDPALYEARVMMAEAKLNEASANYEYALQQVEVKTAEAALARSQAHLVRDEKELERTQVLTTQGVNTAQDLEMAVARADSTRAEVSAAQAELTNSKLTEQSNIKQTAALVEVARADLTQARLDLDYCTIKSPFDGLIGISEVDVGNLVGRGEPTLLSTVSVLDPIRVTIAVSEADYMSLVSSNPTPRSSTKEFEMILADGTLFPHKGHFVMADRAVDLKTGTLKLIVEFPNPNNYVRPGQFARVRVAIRIAENALLIPQKAVFDQQSTKVVYVVGPENKVVFRTVTVGDRYEDKFVITEGLQVGEKVIVEGQLKVRPGAVVTTTDKPITEEKSTSETKGN